MSSEESFLIFWLIQTISSFVKEMPTTVQNRLKDRRY